MNFDGDTPGYFYTNTNIGNSTTDTFNDVLRQDYDKQSKDGLKGSIESIGSTTSSPNPTDSNQNMLTKSGSDLYEGIELGLMRNKSILSTAHMSHMSIQTDEIVEKEKSIWKSFCTYYSPYKLFSTHKNKKYYMAKVINLYTHFLIITSFVMLFYFHYIAESEKKLIYEMIKEEEKNIIKYTDVDVTKYYDNPYYEQMCSTLVYGRTDEGNAKIYNDAMYLIIGMLGFLICLIMFEIKMFKYSSFPEEFGWALLLLIMLGSFDYFFFNIVVKNYNVIDRAEIMCELYENSQ